MNKTKSNDFRNIKSFFFTILIGLFLNANHAYAENYGEVLTLMKDEIPLNQVRLLKNFNKQIEDYSSTCTKYVAYELYLKKEMKYFKDLKHWLQENFNRSVPWQAKMIDIFLEHLPKSW